MINSIVSLTLLVSFKIKASPPIKEIPEIVNKLNVFLDTDGLLRVKCKMQRSGSRFKFPILLSKTSIITRLLISDTHVKFAHAGCYSLLTQLRKHYWIDNYFSTVKKVLKGCVVCKRLHGRPIKLNQNSYRDFRVNPQNKPFQYLFLDHMGPFIVKTDSNQRKKVWILVLTCLWSQAVSLKICEDLTVKSFMRAFQMQCVPSETLFLICKLKVLKIVQIVL